MFIIILLVYVSRERNITYCEMMTNVQNFQIFVHSDMKTLHEYVPKEMLPEEYGGTSGMALDEINSKLNFIKLKHFKASYYYLFSILCVIKRVGIY